MDSGLAPAAKRGLLIIVGLGLAVRLIAAFLQPAYIDEAFNVCLCQGGADAIVGALKSDNHTPFLHLLLSPLAHIPVGIFVWRLFSALCGAGAVLASFFVSRRFLSERAALALTAFLALGYHVWISDALFRPYGPLWLSAILLWWGMLDIHSYGSPWAGWSLGARWRWLLWGMCCLLLGSWHFIGVLILAAAVPLVIGLPSSRRYSVLGSLVLGMVPCLAWFAWARLSGPSLALEVGTGHVDLYTALCPLTFLPLYLCDWNLSNLLILWRGTLAGDILAAVIAPVEIISSLLLYAAFARGWWRLSRECRWPAALLGLGFVLPLLFLALASASGLLGPFQARYADAATLAFFILAWRGVSDSLALIWRRTMVGVAALVALIFPFCPVLWVQYWQGTLDFIEAVKQPHDVIAVYIPYATYSFASAYAGDDIRFVRQPDGSFQCQQRENSTHLPVYMLFPQYLPYITQSLPADGRLILVLCQENAYGGSALIEQLDRSFTILHDYHQQSIYAWGTINTYVLQKR